MKAFLLYRDRDLDPNADLPPNTDDLMQDLELDTLFEAMASDDEFLADVAKRAVLSGMTVPEEIAYRQRVLVDCLDHEAVIREMYDLTVKGIQGEKKIWRSFFSTPSSILNSSVTVMELFVEVLKGLRLIAEKNGGQFRSEGFVRFFKMLMEELDDEYFRTVQGHLARLRFPDGVLISAHLGKGNKGTEYVLRRPFEEKQTWRERIFGKRSGYSFEIDDRDESGHQALLELRDRGVISAANALGQSVDHILSFLKMLRTELGFYVCCLNLHERLSRKGEPTCIPAVTTEDVQMLSAQGLYDACLSLKLQERTVGNTLSAEGKELVMITGANQGGKTTFLRSVGLAYLMMQSGMFVAAHRFSASVGHGVFTHFKRGEDATMKSGKLDEELGRMSGIADRIKPRSILLCNESFSATNEREGSEIARQIVQAMLDADIRIFYVTHLYDLALSYYEKGTDAALFLRAERQEDGTRTFKVIEGEPLPTSYGEDLYRQTFGPIEQTERSP
jgi:hypothetical protein